MSNKASKVICMTLTSPNRETLATRYVTEKVQLMLINGIGETAKSNSNTYAMRDYSRVATKDNTPVRYITRVSEPVNVTAWLIANASDGAMARTINGATYYEIGHALGVWDRFSTRVNYPLMPSTTNFRRGARGVSVARALTITDNE